MTSLCKTCDGSNRVSGMPICSWARCPDCTTQPSPVSAPLERAPEWAITRNGVVREVADATKMALRDYGLKGNDSGAFDFGAGFMRGIEYGKLLAMPASPAASVLTDEQKAAIGRIEYFVKTWEYSGVGSTIKSVQDSPDTKVSIDVADLHALLEAYIGGGQS